MEQLLAATKKKELAQENFVKVLEIIDSWGCRSIALKVLRMPRSTFYKYKSQPQLLCVDDDQLERIDYLLGIELKLSAEFSTSEDKKQFMNTGNSGAFFEGRTPVSVIGSGKFADLYEVYLRVSL